MSADILADVSEIKKVRLEPGDVLFVQVKPLINRAEADAIRGHLERQLAQQGVPPVPIIILDGDVKIGIISRAELRDGAT